MGGFNFTPTARSYSHIITDQLNQDYVDAVSSYTISGNAGIAGATLNWLDGMASSTVADETGITHLQYHPIGPALLHRH